MLEIKQPKNILKPPKQSDARNGIWLLAVFWFTDKKGIPILVYQKDVSLSFGSFINLRSSRTSSYLAQLYE